MPTRARRFTSQASVGMFASRIPSSQLSKNDSFSTVKKRPVLHYTCAGRAICASFDPLGVYIYAVGVESCATRLPLLRSVPLTDPNRGRAWHPREFGAVLGGSASLPLPATPLPSSSRRYAPQCFVGEYTSSPCDVSHRASDEPRRRMSLSSALAPSSLASSSIRRVFFVASALADVSSARLTLPAYPPERSGVAEGELNAGCKSAALETAFVMGAKARCLV